MKWFSLWDMQEEANAQTAVFAVLDDMLEFSIERSQTMQGEADWLHG
jgi:hypothetical protein